MKEFFFFGLVTWRKIPVYFVEEGELALHLCFFPTLVVFQEPKALKWSRISECTLSPAFFTLQTT